MAPRCRPPLWLLLALCLQVVIAGRPGFSEHLLAHVADHYGSAAHGRVLDWEGLILASRGRSDREKLELVNRFFNAFDFVDDRDHWGRRDYWATPVELIGTRGGDCEDFSIAKYFTLKEMGVPVKRMRITYVKALSLRRAHMVLAYYPQPDADPLILDNLVDEVRSGSQRRDLVPVYSFNGDGLWMARERGQGRRVASAAGISLWRDLTDRMVREGAFADDGPSFIRQVHAAAVRADRHGAHPLSARFSGFSPRD